MYKTLVDSETMAEQLFDPSWVVVDCRFSLADTEAGRRAYQHGHIPGALYVHLDDDLSGPPVTDRGRHPLPTPEALNGLFSRLGITAGVQVVAYDDGPGAIASRLWWLLHYMGHEAAAVLDGGWAAWQAAQLPARGGDESRAPAHFTGAPRRDRLVLVDEVADARLLVDSRAPDRYRGEVEPLDPVAGHIPGAVNYHFGRNLTAEGRFRPPAELQAQMMELLVGEASDEAVFSEAVFYCGSGVTACHNLLAQAHAGLPVGRLYAGSWSDWIADPERAVSLDSDSKTLC